MSDMRQKLLPVFLEEAGRKMLQLDTFLTTPENEKTLEELEAAFRAAHTLKGTAALVQAESVCSLSGRIEGLLEGHFELNRFPSRVEYEAMQLALDRLKTLVDAVEKGSAEPAGIAAEAELALKLAMAFPGRKPLGDLLEQNAIHDPFAEDPQPDDFAEEASDVTLSLTPGEDPFAEDPSLDSSPVLQDPLSDPFADDPALDAGLVADSVADPFADGPALDSALGSADDADEAVLSAGTGFHSKPGPDQKDPGEDLEEEPAAEQVDLTEADPFAEDPEPVPEALEVPVAPPRESFAERMRKRIESESALGTAERLASTLLMQREGTESERNYACCQFRIAKKDYYLPIRNMVEIADLPHVTRLPLAPPVVRGLINLRGRVLPLIDLALQEGTTSGYVAVQKIVVAEADGEQLAFLTDGVPDLSDDLSGEKIDVKAFVAQFRAGAS